MNLDKIKGHSNASGHILNNDAFANVLYDINAANKWIDPRVTPYIGAGVGADWADVRDISASGIGRLNGDTSAHFAYQGIAGVATNLDPNWAVFAGLPLCRQHRSKGWLCAWWRRPRRQRFA